MQRFINFKILIHCMSEQKKSTLKTLSDPKFKSMVDTAINEMQVMENKLQLTGMDAEEAKLRVQQIYFKNLETFSDPVNAAVSLMAELKTRIDLDRMLNPEEDLVGEKYIELLDQMRKTTKLLMDAKGKSITHTVQVQDDKEMRFANFIDVEDE